jgi:hypothetical protein
VSVLAAPAKYCGVRSSVPIAEHRLDLALLTEYAHLSKNSRGVKKPRKCLEYIVVHELLHLLGPTHNERFIKLMDQHMPKWPSHRQLLNSLPVRHESWGY